ncbi:hypothetical protein ACLB2K_036696 [Fragaria x ananassa]
MRVDEEGERGGREITYGAVTVEALPEGFIANIISLTTPPDGCRLSSVSRSFRQRFPPSYLTRGLTCTIADPNPRSSTSLSATIRCSSTRAK